MILEVMIKNHFSYFFQVQHYGLLLINEHFTLYLQLLITVGNWQDLALIKYFDVCCY